MSATLWEYVVRLSVSGEVVQRVVASDSDEARAKAVRVLSGRLPSFVEVRVEGAREADPPSISFFLRGVSA